MRAGDDPHAEARQERWDDFIHVIFNAPDVDPEDLLP